MNGVLFLKLFLRYTVCLGKNLEFFLYRGEFVSFLAKLVKPLALLISFSVQNATSISVGY